MLVVDILIFEPLKLTFDSCWLVVYRKTDHWLGLPGPSGSNSQPWDCCMSRYLLVHSRPQHKTDNKLLLLSEFSEFVSGQSQSLMQPNNSWYSNIAFMCIWSDLYGKAGQVGQNTADYIKEWIPFYFSLHSPLKYFQMETYCKLETALIYLLGKLPKLTLTKSSSYWY